MAPRAKAKEAAAQHEVDDGRPTVADLQGNNPFALLAKKTWLKSSKKPSKVKVKPDVLKTEIWDVLEREDFAFKSLLVLENLQILEKYTILLPFAITLLTLFQLSLARLFRGLVKSPRSSYSINYECSDSRTSANMGSVPLEHLRRDCANWPRFVFGQPRRVLISFSTSSLYDIRYHAVPEYSNTSPFIYNKRLSIIGQWDSEERMRPFGVDINLE